MSKDQIGDRMKENYENRTRMFLPRRTYTIIRLDGKAFHTYTRGFERPFDKLLMGVMDKTAVALCKGIQGVKVGYVQSDEISLLLTDFETEQTDSWFDGNIQKIVSISAAMAAAEFNRIMLTDISKRDGKEMVTVELLEKMKLAYFDARTYTIPDPTEVANYFIWRQQDATRNSIQMVAQSFYSQKELHGKNTSELQELIFQKGKNWNDFTSGEKRGRSITRTTYELQVKEDAFGEPVSVSRGKWVALDGDKEDETPIFTQDRDFLMSRIPLHGATK